MDQVRIISEKLSFVPFNYEYTFFAPQTDRILVQDLLLSLYGAPGVTHPGGSFGISCNNIFFYIDGKDLTLPLLEELRRLLDASDQVRAKKQYSDALDKWISLLTQLNITDTVKERAIAAALLSTQPLSGNLKSLGDAKVGFGGHLHIFNFLYKEVELAPVSLFQVIKAHNNQNPDEKINPLEIKRLTFSSGPCRLFSPNFSTNNIPTGTLSCQFEILVHDTLEDKLDALQSQLALLQKNIETGLTDIRKLLTSDISKKLREIKTSVDDTSRDITIAKFELLNLQKRIDSLENTSQEILKSIN
ncbi:hypothetical protein [Dyadobacter sp. 22481]|uniref:hypothetical protein n=1 Tax=Dyadobacter sp. 22481 TaxID=3453926 RepID=UPI003F853649